MTLPFDMLMEHLKNNHQCAAMATQTETQTVLRHIETDDWVLVIATQLHDIQGSGGSTGEQSLQSQGSFIQPHSGELITLEHIKQPVLDQLLRYGNEEIRWCQLVCGLPHTATYPRLLRSDKLHAAADLLPQVDTQLELVTKECLLLREIIYEIDRLEAPTANRYVDMLCNTAQSGFA